jgi:Fic family protein
MTWNWQLPEWPEFKYDPERVASHEARFLHGSGLLLGAFGTFNEEERDLLRINLLGEEAWETSDIEGEFLNRESLQSSLRRQFGLEGDSRKVPPAEQGVSEVMVEAFRHFDEDLTCERLCRWQALLMKGKHGLHDIGRFRTTEEPMQVVSGPIHQPVVHFEAVPSARVPGEMDAFLAWFNGSRGTIPAIARAALSHVYFESIHPFEDGNGRVGRTIAEVALSQSLGKPVLLALSYAINARKRSYYDELEKANRTLNLDSWVPFFAETVIEAQERAGRLVKFLIEKTRLFDRLNGLINSRQEKVLLRVFAEGPEGFKGGLSSANYRKISRASTATATRDLAQLIELGALKRTGEKKHTRYWLNLPDREEGA